MCKRQKVFGLLAIAVMIAIFCFSARDADQSTEDSLKVGMTIGRIIKSDFDKLPYEEQISYAESIDHKVRKTAHFLEYTLLGMLLLMTFFHEESERLMPAVYAWFTGSIYAVTDELHQFFVPGRSCQVTDVLIDSGGVLTGVIFVSFLLIIIIRIKRRTQD